jgi:hypothetical protein
LLADREQSVAEATIQALLRCGSVDAKIYLQELMRDKQSPLWHQAVTALATLGDHEAIGLLKQSMTIQQFFEDDHLLAGLCRANDPEAWEEMHRRLGFGESALNLQQAAQLAATELPDARLVPTMAASLSKLRDNVTLPSVLNALDRIGDPAAIPALTDLLPESDGLAFQFGGNLGGNPVIPVLEDLAGQALGPNQLRWTAWWQQQAPTALKDAVTQLPSRAVKFHSTLPIHNAVTTGDIDRVRELLDQNPALIKSPETVGGTGLLPLQVAALEGQLEIAKLLLERGADLESRWSLNNATPLLLALHSKHPELAKYFILQGANVNASDSMKRTPLKYAIDYDYPELQQLLRDHGAQ